MDSRRQILALLEDFRRDYFLARIGPSAVNYESGGGDGYVFDDMASHRLHMRFRNTHHRANMARGERVRYALERISYQDRRVLELALDPASPGYGGDQLVRHALGLPETNISLVALVPESKVMPRLAARAARIDPEHQWDSKAGYASIVAGRVRQGDKKFVNRVRNECWRMLETAAEAARVFVREYDAREKARVRAEVQRIERLMAG